MSSCSSCNFIYFHRQTSLLTSELEQQITTTLGIPLQFDSAEILGCPIAKSKELLQVKAKEIAHKQMKMFEVLLHDNIPHQHAIYLLRLSGSQS